MTITDQSSYIDPKAYSAVPLGGVFSVTVPSPDIYLKTEGGSFKVTNGTGPLSIAATDKVIHYILATTSLY